MGEGVKLLRQGTQKTNASWGKEIESTRDGGTKMVRGMAAAAGWIATARTRSLAGQKGNGLGTDCMRDEKPKWEWARRMKEDGASQGMGKGYSETGDDIESRKETGWWSSP